MFHSDPRTTHELLAERLSELLGTQHHHVTFGDRPSSALVTFSRHTFVVEAKDGSSAASVAAGLGRLASAPPDLIPLIAVPKMSRVGQHLCERAGVSWIDAAGRARIAGPSLPTVVAL